MTVTREDRARARQAPAWRWLDSVTFVLVAGLILLAAINPRLMADWGQIIVGSEQPVPGLEEISWSQLIFAAQRWAVVCTACFVLFAVRSIPLILRVVMVFIVAALAMNFARNVFSGQPNTLSFCLGNIALLLNNFRLMSRPSIWEELQQWRAKARDLEHEVALLESGERLRQAEAQLEEARHEARVNYDAAETWRQKFHSVLTAPPRVPEGPGS